MSDDIDLGIDGLRDYRQIGTGGFSTVYAAWDEGFSRWVAVKVLHSLDEAGRRRFDRERGIMGRLADHPNVITPFAFGYTSTGAPYVVMEFVEGGSLDDLLGREGLVPWHRAVDLLLPVVGALAYAHSRGVLHRDIKPGNILLAPEATKLTDFGIAAIREATATQVAFTLAHCPPETFAGGADNRDERSDLYSLGSTMFTLVTGSPPFHVEGNDSQPAYMVRIADNAAPSLPTGIGPPALDEFLRRALAKDPADRPPDADAFADELHKLRAPGEQPPAGEARRDEAVVAATTPLDPDALRGIGPNRLAAGQPRPSYSDSISDRPTSVAGPEAAPSTDEKMGGRFLLSVVGSIALVAALVSAFVLLGGGDPREESPPGANGPGSTDSATSTTEEGDAAEPALVGGDGILTVGSLRPVTGAIEALGPAHDLAIRLAVDEINESGGVFGSPITVVDADSGDPGSERATIETDGLLNNGVDVVIGPLASLTTFQVVDQVIDSGALVFSPANTSPDLTGFPDQGRYFRSAASSVVQGRVLAELVIEDGDTSASIIHLEDSFSQGLIDGFVARYNELGGTLDTTIAHGPDTTDFTAPVAELAAQGSDAIIVLGRAESAAVIEAMDVVGIGPTASTSVWGTEDNTAAIDGLENHDIAVGFRHLVPGVDPASAPQLFERLGSELPTEAVTDFAPHTYDAVVVIALAAAVAMQDDGAAIAAEINEITRGGTPCTTYVDCLAVIDRGEDPDYDGLSGPLEFSDDGEPPIASYRIELVGPEGREPVGFVGL